MMFKLINPYVALGVLLALVAAFSYGLSLGGDRADAKHAKVEALLTQVRDEAQASAAAAIAKIKIVNRPRIEVLEREIHTVPAGTCVLSPDGVRALNEVLTNRPESAGRGVVPGTDASP